MAVIIVGIILASLVGYFGIGLALAKLSTKYLARLNTDRVRYKYPSIKRDRYTRHGLDREALKKSQGVMIGCWPVYGPILLLGGSLDRSIDLVDPEVVSVKEQRLKAVEADIKRLEKELGI